MGAEGGCVREIEVTKRIFFDSRQIGGHVFIHLIEELGAGCQK